MLVTRARGRNTSLIRALEAAGVEAVELPLLAFEPTGAPPPAAWDVLVFTSATAVGFWKGPLTGFVAAVGPTTAAALRGRADLVPERALGEALAEALGDLRGKRVCYPRADKAPPAFEQALRGAGAELSSFVQYRTVLPPSAKDELASVLPVDRVALASGSAARHLVEVGGAGCPVVCIGPSTAAVARELGLEVAGVASVHTAEGLARACLQPPRSA